MTYRYYITTTDGEDMSEEITWSESEDLPIDDVVGVQVHLSILFRDGDRVRTPSASSDQEELTKVINILTQLRDRPQS